MQSLAVFPSQREVRLIEQPEPSISRSHEVKIRMLEVGVCGTDREIASFVYGSPPAGSTHLVIGHESLGEVVEAGTEVSSLSVGDLCVLMVRRPCPHEHCQPCRIGRQDFCTTGDFTERGIKQLHGFMTEYVVDDEQYVVRLPRDLRHVGVLLEPLTIAEKAVEQIQIVAQRLPRDLSADPRLHRGIVLGAGPVGLLGAMRFVAAGVQTWVYSRGHEETPNALVVKAMGATYVSSDHHSPTDLAEITGGVGIIYEATGAAKVSFDVLAALGANGICVFTGVPGRKEHIEIDGELIMRNMVLRNQLVLGTVNAGRNSFEAGVRNLATSTTRFPDAVRALITSRVSVAAARETVTSPPPGIKAVVTFH